MTPLETLAFLAGVALVVTSLADVFQSILLPRPVGRLLRPSAYVSRSLWRTWVGVGMRIADEERRENTLGAFAPFAMITFLVMWVSGLVIGWGCIFYGLRSQVHPVPDFPAAIYFAATSLLTIGFGDFVPTSLATRLCSILAGASGFGTVAVVTTFLFSVFAAFQRREVFVVLLGHRAGAPPSGVELMRTYAELKILPELGRLFFDGQTWSAEVMESHLAYPILAYFRSSHDNESWVGALGALMDAATLLLTATVGEHPGEAKLMLRLGAHFTHDFCSYFNLEFNGEVGVERAEFETAWIRLGEAGIPVRDCDESWLDFARVRKSYASQLNAMARFWRIPPAQWIGDRSTLPYSHRITRLAPAAPNANMDGTRNPADHGIEV